MRWCVTSWVIRVRAIEGEGRWAAAVQRYRRLESHGDPATALSELGSFEPERAPDEVLIVWHEVQAACWARLAAQDSTFTSHDELIGGHHREQVRRLKNGSTANGKQQGRRNGVRQATPE